MKILEITNIEELSLIQKPKIFNDKIIENCHNTLEEVNYMNVVDSFKPIDRRSEKKTKKHGKFKHCFRQPIPLF